jgi:hypothetical protein
MSIYIEVIKVKATYLSLEENIEIQNLGFFTRKKSNKLEE